MDIPRQFRYKVEVWGKVEALNESNKTTFIDSKLMDEFAEIVPQTGSLQKQQADTILSKVTHKVIMRYRDNITPNMYLCYKGKRFDIRYILNPYFRNEILEIFVEEVIQ